MTDIRVYTVAEALALPPPTEEKLEQRRVALALAAETTRRALERRGGIPIPWEDIEWALEWDDDDQDVPAK
ncbi:MAG: hypothetical protein ACKVT1_20920 [Dehalococcoidia bacterium]